VQRARMQELRRDERDERRRCGSRKYDDVREIVGNEREAPDESIARIGVCERRFAREHEHVDEDDRNRGSRDPRAPD